MYTKLNTCISG